MYFLAGRDQATPRISPLSGRPNAHARHACGTASREPEAAPPRGQHCLSLVVADAVVTARAPQKTCERLASRRRVTPERRLHTASQAAARRPQQAHAYFFSTNFGDVLYLWLTSSGTCDQSSRYGPWLHDCTPLRV